MLGYAAFKIWHSRAGAQPEIHSIAILPLENLSGDPAQEYFADGMTEELINDLGQVSTLRVISLTSSMSYKGTKKKLPEIARELAVDGVVEGGVLREGNQVRISAQLVDARTDRPVWAHTYTRDMTGVLAWQGEVAQDIAEEIRINVTPVEQARLARSRPLDAVAQDFYLRGILKLDLDDCKSANEFFEKALEKNPNYAQPHAALATCFGRMGESGRMPYREAFSRQKTEAAQAIQLGRFPARRPCRAGECCNDPGLGLENRGDRVSTGQGTQSEFCPHPHEICLLPGAHRANAGGNR